MITDVLKITISGILAVSALPAMTQDYVISDQEMQAVYEEVKTPYKYGVVIEPPEGRMVDGPNVFRKDGKWYMELESSLKKI